MDLFDFLRGRNPKIFQLKLFQSHVVLSISLTYCWRGLCSCRYTRNQIIKLVGLRPSGSSVCDLWSRDQSQNHLLTVRTASCCFVVFNYCHCKVSEPAEAALMFVFICHVTECKFLYIIGPEQVEALKNQSLTANRTSSQLSPPPPPPPRCWCTNRLWNTFWFQLKLYRGGQLTGMTGRLCDAARQIKKKAGWKWVLFCCCFQVNFPWQETESSLEKWREKVISPFSTDIWPGEINPRPPAGGGDSSIMSRERHSSSTRSSQSLIVCSQGRDPNTDFNRS